MGGEDNRVHILKNVTLDVERGEFIAVTGPSGSGKSTLLNILGCLDKATSGSYLLNGKETALLDSHTLAALRSRTFGFVFQRYNLLSSLSAVDNVALPAVYVGMPRNERLAKAAILLDSLGLAAKIHSKPNELSGGQQQRASIARALMNGGEIILADEPTGALDSQSGEVVMHALKDLNDSGHTIILVTHNPEVAAYAHRVIEIFDGEIVSDHVKERPRQNARFSSREKNTFSTGTIYKVLESFLMAMQTLSAHKLQSALTILGIIIGIASVVTVVALVRGSQEKILSDIQSLGTNTIEIHPGRNFGDIYASRMATLTVGDVESLESQTYISNAAPVITSNEVVLHQNSSARTLIFGVNDQYMNVKGMTFATGRNITKDDIINNNSIAVIDQKAKKSLFKNGENPLGKILIANLCAVEVVGVLEEQNNKIGMSHEPKIYVPFTTVMHKLSGVKNINSIIVKISDSVNSQVAEKSVTELLTSRRQGKKDFFTFNTDSIRKAIEKTADTLTLLVFGIAFISLLVGGIGVMNIMLVSVTERTPEIGLRMAVGANQNSILLQFLIEAVAICIIGGISGIALSFLGMPFFNMLIGDFALAYSLESVFVALFCSALVGVTFGIAPALNASKLNPIEALNRN